MADDNEKPPFEDAVDQRSPDDDTTGDTGTAADDAALHNNSHDTPDEPTDATTADEPTADTVDATTADEPTDATTADEPTADTADATAADEPTDAAPVEAEASAPEAEAEHAGTDGPTIPSVLPVLPVRDVVIFNYMILPLFIGRENSARAVDAAIKSGRYLLVSAQKEEGTDDPGPQDLYSVGTVVQILRMLKMPDSRVKLLIQGICRAQITNYERTAPYLEAHIEILEEENPDADATVEALLRSVREQSEKVLSLRGLASPDVLSILQGVDDPGRLADLIAANMRMKTADAQRILETSNPVKRLELVNSQLQREVEVATVQARIQSSAREGMDKAQKDYFLREQLKAIHNELGDKGENSEEDLSNLRKALDEAGLPKEAYQEADKQLRRLASMHPESSEATMARTYLDWMVELPWKKLSRDRMDIHRAKEILDEDHCGLAKVKDRIIEFLSVRKLNPQTKGSILCFAGPPGVGKTSLGRSIARTLGRKFQRISLGGMRDEAEIRGHRRTYIGSMPGRIIQALKQAGTRNPVIMLDEVDKLGTDFRGDPSSALLEVLDPEQNCNFSDHYLNVPFDLSKVMFIGTANHLENIPDALRDRMEVLSLPGYTLQEKVEIARKHLLEKQIKGNGLKADDLPHISDEALTKIIREYTREAGVRNLERSLASICRKLARRKAEGEKGPFAVDVDDVESLLGVPRYVDDEKEQSLLPGMALGLAWTPVGGEVLTVEATLMKGKGALHLTGQLGDVMKESAQAALSYIRSHAEALGVDPGFLTRHDVHVHVPAGATPKDGPSAGITLTTALISSLSGRRARADVCMTGEITLLGRVLPVGGIKEKILAAVARNLQHVLIPRQNVKDLEEVPKDLLERIAVHPVHAYDEVPALVFEDSAAASAPKDDPSAETPPTSA